MGMHISTARPGHLPVLQAGTDGKSLELIFPNDLDKKTAILVGETTLPRPNWQLDTAGPPGKELCWSWLPPMRRMPSRFALPWLVATCRSWV
ncbi:MAG: DUF4384 domain-containing protein [Nitrosomonadales bacterium]|nr:DUF4384 domain-containing protein [Nitrosomonadales bacterium]